MRRMWAAIIGMGALAASVPAAAGTYSVIYQFPPYSSGFGEPSSLVALPSGSLVGFGRISDQIFKLDPPATGQTAWTFSIIYDFGNYPLPDQYADETFLVDAAGNLYGTTGAITYTDAGSFFRLSPPRSGKGSWTCTVLYHHNDPTGTNYIPRSLVYLNHTGRQLYGTATSVTGSKSSVSLFRLNLPDPAVSQATANLTVISPNLVPNGNATVTQVAVVPSAEGNFYGGENGYGTGGGGSIFRVSPPGTGVAQEQLQTLTTAIPGGYGYVQSLAVDRSDRITGLGGPGTYGNIWRLAPPSNPGGAWQSSILYAFKGTPGHDGSWPAQLVSHNGLFFGITTYGGQVTPYGDLTDISNGRGTLFELASPAAGSTGTAWREHLVHTFTGRNSADGEEPIALAQATEADGTYALYGLTVYGGKSGTGTIFRYVP